jgi:hypothetical protein
MKAVYPLVGQSATSQKYNLKNPLDTNAAFRLVFNGGWTHSFNGITGNGTNTYADTYVLGGTNITGSNYGYGVYINTEADQNTQDVGVGANSHLIANFGGLTYFRGLELYIDGTYLNNSSKGFFHQYGKAGSGESSTGFINGTKRATLNGPGYLDAANVYIGGRTIYSSKRYCFGFVSDKLTDTEATNLYTAVQNFQISLGRAIYLSPPTVSDSDAQAFINAANIIDQTEANAVNNLTIGLKADNLWTKMKAVYPMVGGVASSQKYNLINPLDTNAAFRLTFNGGWTHSFNGALPNGTNAYTDTFIIPNTNLTNNSTHFSYYSRTTSVGAMIEMGSLFSGSTTFNMMVKYVGGGFDGFFSDQYDTNTNRIYTANSDSKGFYIGTRTTSTVHKAYKNGTQIGTTNTGISLGLTNFSAAIKIGNRSDLPAGVYSNRQCAFASIGDGLSDTEAINLYNRVQTFNTTLNRQV